MTEQRFKLETLIELAEELRLAGFDIGTQQTIAAQDLLVALAAHNRLPSDPDDWRTLLAPIFCASPGEQEEFYFRFEQWRKRHPELRRQDKPESLDKADPLSAPAHSRFPWLRRRFGIALLWLLILLAGVAGYLVVSSSPDPQTSPPVQPPQQPIRIEWQRILIVASPLLLFAAWWLWRRRERRARRNSCMARRNAGP
jgi:hypothetical protein